MPSGSPSEPDRRQPIEPPAPPCDAAPGVPIVALGTSAGGLAACTTFFEHLSTDTGCAFVVVQHLAPQHDSHLAELLAKATAMPVLQIQNGVVPEADHVYVIPPDAALTIAGPKLGLLPRNTTTVPMPIDGFLRALAQQRGPHAIAVIMSGSGSDGSLGVQSIQEHGGVALAQDPADASFDGMPRSAIATGCIDVVLPATQLAAEVGRIARAQSRSPDSGAGHGYEQVEDREALAEVINRLRKATGIDFSKYRLTTLTRRLRRRIHLLGLRDMLAYRTRVDGDPGELQELARDILIAVTRFFRDTVAFAFLQQQVFPALIRRASADGVVRIWVAGCSTGEEAYSLAIAFVETAARMRSDVTCQVFATDINEAVLVKARQGVYLENIAIDVAKERLERFFRPATGGYRIDRSIRDLCVFSRHDLLSDPPLSRMDLVSCRNLLIYLAVSQIPVLHALHFALEPDGYLLLGQAETAASCPDLFEVVDKEAHVFRARQKLERGTLPRSARDGRRRPLPVVPLDAAASGAAYEELLAVNEELQSLNEELESSKEEIESVNEELQTLNQELNSRNAALQVAHDFLDTTLDTLRSGLVVVDRDGLVTRANRSFCQLFHLPPDAAEDRRLADIAPDYFARADLQQLVQAVASGDTDRENGEFLFPSTPRGARVLLVHVRRIQKADSLLIAIDDVTEQRQTETDRRHSQKMEAIGHLAAGVAHDFNNLLTVVLAGAQSVADDLPTESPHANVLGDVITATLRAAELTRQLLAYAGKGRQFAERVDLSDVALQSARLLNASVPTHVQLRLDLDRELPPLLADRSQVHQVVDNLIKNAIEAIGDKVGVVTVRTGRQTVARDDHEGVDPGSKLPAGDYLFLEVQDTGLGLSPENQRQMFDPFFSTKFTGRGLGLAVVQGIVRQHRGTIRVASVPGRGTSIRVLLSTDSLLQALPPRSETGEPRRGTETVLVVDDEPSVVTAIKLALAQLGYEPLVATGGPQGLSMLQANPRIAAVVLDANMPGMSGIETLSAMRSIRPEVAVLVCSGAGDAATESAFARQNVVGFLHKPFTSRELGLRLAACFAEA